MINCNDPSFTDILNQCLKWDPKERITPQEALSHPFITGLKFKSSYESHKRYSTASNSFAKVSESPKSWNRSSATLTSNFTNNSPSIPSTTGHSRLSTVGGSKQENRKSASGFFGFASSKFYEKLPKPSLPPLLGPKRFSTKKDSPSKNESTSDENGSESRKLVCYY